MDRMELGTWSSTELTPQLLLVPIGAVEQHGPHLPLDTDVRIASAVAHSAATQVGGLVAPPLSYGSSGEHQSFAGTISLGARVVGEMIVEYGRSASNWAPRMVFVNGHGGNVPPLRAAIELLRYEGRDVAWFACAPPDASPTDTHAGDAETSLLLHISPELVRREKCEVGNTTALSELMPQLTSGGLGSVSANGVLGDPTSASSARGREMFDAMVSDLVDAASSWQVADGRIGRQQAAGV